MERMEQVERYFYKKYTLCELRDIISNTYKILYNDIFCKNCCSSVPLYQMNISLRFNV